MAVTDQLTGRVSLRDYSGWGGRGLFLTFADALTLNQSGDLVFATTTITTSANSYLGANRAQSAETAAK